MTLTIRQDARPHPTIPSYWEWLIWLDGEDGELDEIEAVRYQLHETFAKPTRTITDRASNFGLSASGWGEFTIYAAVRFKGGRREDQLLNHWLRLGDASDPAPIAAAKRTAPSVFLSSSFADAHLAQELAEALRARQVHVIDPTRANAARH